LQKLLNIIKNINKIFFFEIPSIKILLIQNKIMPTTDTTYIA